mgnify:CR=1 FL=1
MLCDVSGSVANFASFTLMLVFALREQFNRVRAFTFVDEIHEVTDRFTAGADPARTMADLAASADYFRSDDSAVAASTRAPTA